MRGRPPDADSTRVLRGTFRRDRARGPAPSWPGVEPLATLPDPAGWMPEDVAHVWRDLGGELVRLQVLTELDLYALEQTCFALAHVRRRSSAGQPVSPAALRTVLALLAQFGACPTGRRMVRSIGRPATANRFEQHGVRPDE